MLQVCVDWHKYRERYIDGAVQYLSALIETLARQRFLVSVHLHEYGFDAMELRLRAIEPAINQRFRSARKRFLLGERPRSFIEEREWGRTGETTSAVTCMRERKREREQMGVVRRRQ